MFYKVQYYIAESCGFLESVTHNVVTLFQLQITLSVTIYPSIHRHPNTLHAKRRTGYVLLSRSSALKVVSLFTIRFPECSRYLKMFSNNGLIVAFSKVMMLININLYPCNEEHTRKESIVMKPVLDGMPYSNSLISYHLQVLNLLPNTRSCFGRGTLEPVFSPRLACYVTVLGDRKTYNE